MSGKNKMVLSILAISMIVVSVVLVVGFPKEKTVPHEEKWGIYVLDLATEEVELLYSSSKKISRLRLNSAGDRFVFSQHIDSDSDECVIEGTPIDLCE